MSMSQQAKPVPVCVLVLNPQTIGSDRVFETPCEDYERFAKLPGVCEFEGRLYAKTGWNSDTGLACYKTGRMIAKEKIND